MIEGLVGAGTTVLLTTQYLEEADRLADNIVVIDHGSVIAEGTATELKGRLGSTHIEVNVPIHEVDRARAALVTVGVETLADTANGVAIQVADSGRAVIEAVRALDAAGVDVEALAVREPTLDDVFLELTGHAAETGTEVAS